MAEPAAQHDTIPRADYEDGVQALSAEAFFRRSCRRPFSMFWLGNYIQEDPAPVATPFDLSTRSRHRKLGDFPHPQFVEPAMC